MLVLTGLVYRSCCVVCCVVLCVVYCVACSVVSVYVNVNGVNSNMENIDYGVPQGSLLGPLLFIVYINDFVYCCSDIHKVISADDTNLFVAHKKTEQLEKLLNQQLVKVNTWFKYNKLSLNINKTFYIVFRSSRRKYCDPHMNIILDGKSVKKVESTKFLGVHIDQFLNFKKHIAEIEKKLSKIDSFSK